MKVEEYIVGMAERARAAGYGGVDAFSLPMAEELRRLDFTCFARRVGGRLDYFGARSGDGMGREQVRHLTNQFHNAGRLALAERADLTGIHGVAALVCEKEPQPEFTSFLLDRARPTWPFAARRSTPVLVDLSRGRVLTPWFMAKAVSRTLLAPQ